MNNRTETGAHDESAPRQPARNAPAGPALPWSHRELWGLGALFLLALTLRLYRCGSRSFWIDEFQTYTDAMRIFDADFGRQTHFLFFYLVRASLALGYNEFTLRLPSLIFSSLAPPMIYLAGRRWFGDRRVAALAGLLTSVSLYQLYFASEARYYGVVTCLSALSMFLLHGLLTRPRTLGLLLFVLVNLCNYGIHPATAVFGAAQVVFWASHLLFTGRLRRLAGRLPRKPKLSWRLAAEATTVAATAAILWIGFSHLFGRYVWRLWERLQQIGDPSFPLTQGVEFSTTFFLAPIFRFALLQGHRLGLGPLSGGLFIAVFAVGLVAGLVRFRRHTAFILTAYGLTYISLFMLYATIPYASKYVIFLYPCFALTVATGLLTLGAAVLWPVRRIAAGRRVEWVAAALLLLLQAAQWRNYHSFLAYDVQPYRPALERIRSEQPEGGIFHAAQFWHGFDYYAPQYGFDEDHYVSGPVERDAVLRALRSGEPLWVCLGAHSDPARIQAMAPFFEKKADIPAFSAPRWGHTLYVNDGKNMLFPGAQTRLELRFGQENSTQAQRGVLSLEPVAPGRWEGGASLWAAGPLEGRLRIDGPAERLRSATARVRGAGADAELAFEKEDGSFVSALFPLEAGPVELRLALEGEGGPIEDPLWLSVFDEQGWMPAFLFSKEIAYSQNYSIVHENKDAYAVPRNGSLAYRIDVPRAGRFQFHLEAVHDKPLPVIVEAAVNGRPLGLLWFGKTDNQLGEQPFCGDLREGPNELRFSFLNDGPGVVDTPQLSDKNTDFILTGFRYTRLAPGEDGLSALVPSAGFIAPPSAQGKLSFGRPGPDARIGPPWVVKGDFSTEILDEGKTLKVAVPPRGPGCAVGTRLFPVQSDRLLCWRLRMRCEGLENHSANVQIVYFDEQQRMIGKEWLYPIGISGTTDWREFPCARYLWREKARFAGISLSVYPNATQRGRKPGTVWFSDFEFWPKARQ
jgi:hypothetical protein